MRNYAGGRDDDESGVRLTITFAWLTRCHLMCGQCTQCGIDQIDVGEVGSVDSMLSQ